MLNDNSNNGRNRNELQVKDRNWNENNRLWKIGSNNPFLWISPSIEQYFEE